MPQPSIGHIKWQAETPAGEVVSAGETDVYPSDVLIKVVTEEDVKASGWLHVWDAMSKAANIPRVQRLHHQKRVELGDGFVLLNPENVLEQGDSVMPLWMEKDEQRYMGFEFLMQDRPGRVRQVRDTGMILFERSKTAAGYEFTRMEFVSDFRIPLKEVRLPSLLRTVWTVRIFAGSWIEWPSLSQDT